MRELSRSQRSQSVRWLTTVDEALTQLRSANVAFNTPDRARVGKQFIIEAKLSTKLTQKEVKVSIEEAGKVEAADLKVSDRMVATLSGGSAFDVSPGDAGAGFVKVLCGPANRQGGWGCVRSQ